MRDPIVHISTLGSLLTFPAGTVITKRSGEAGFTVSGNTVQGAVPDVAGTIQLSGDFDAISFSALWTLSGQPDGIDFQVGGVPVPVPTVTPTPSPTVMPTPAVTAVPTVAPPRAGVSVTAQVATGQVLVKASGGQFLPLRGTASVPVGATVDTRKGTLALVTEGGDTAQVAAGIFTIRQARKGVDRVPELVVATPAGLARACARGHTPPAKGIVRTLTVTVAKGTFRTKPAKGTVTGRNATWTTTDRCDGTLTTVRKGRVSIRLDRKTISVRAGHRYKIAPRLFGARQVRDRGGCAGSRGPATLPGKRPRVRGVLLDMITNTWSAREHLESLRIEHSALTHQDVVTLSYSLRGWPLLPTTPCGAPPIVARVWLFAAVNARGRYQAPERPDHRCDLDDGGPLVDSIVLMAIIQRHFLREAASAWDDHSLAAQLGLDREALTRAQRVLDTVLTLPARNPRPAPLGHHWWVDGLDNGARARV